MANVNITVDGVKVSVPEGATILEAARKAGVDIPTLCAYEGMKPHAACRLCIVNVNDDKKTKLACATKVAEGMAVTANSDELFAQRKATLTEMFRQHTVDCHQCARTGGSTIENLDPAICENCFYCDCQREGFCELQALSRRFGISALPFEPHEHDFEIDSSTGTIIRDPNKCIKCRRCVDVCQNTQGVGVLGMIKTDNGQTVGVKTAATLAESDCIRCGRCVDVCPTGAVFLKEHKDEMPYFAHLHGVKTAALVDESVLPELSRLYGGEISLGQLASALRKIGIDKVYNADELRTVSAQAAAKKLSARRKKSPAILAADPAAKKYLEKFHADLKSDFIFLETAQERFAEYAKGNFDKVFRISGRNSLAQEVQDSKCADYFYNARELFRILKRTGANPVRRAAEELDSLGAGVPETEYAPVLGAVEWRVGGEPEKITLTAKGKDVPAVICHNPAQLKAALEDTDARIIRVIS